MARQRRGGLPKPELKGTLGTLLRTTLAQAGAVREVLERGAREGRSRLDGVMANRRRNEALAELGEIVLELIRRGEIDANELPEVRGVVAHLDELDADRPPEHDDALPSPARKRFDDRRRDDVDGTVSSGSWSKPDRPRKRSDTKVWRPTPPRPSDEVTSRERPKMPGAKKGGISFEDEDLADYMHPDDVPPKEGDP